MKVKFIHLPKDNEIDSMECSDCGRSIRHAVEINGQVYGLDCGAKRLGYPTTTKKNLEAKFFNLSLTVNSFIRNYTSLCEGNQDNFWNTVRSAHEVNDKLNLGITTKAHAAFIQEVYEAVK